MLPLRTMWTSRTVLICPADIKGDSALIETAAIFAVWMRPAWKQKPSWIGFASKHNSSIRLIMEYFATVCKEPGKNRKGQKLTCLLWPHYVYFVDSYLYFKNSYWRRWLHTFLRLLESACNIISFFANIIWVCHIIQCLDGNNAKELHKRARPRNTCTLQLPKLTTFQQVKEQLFICHGGYTNEPAIFTLARERSIVPGLLLLMKPVAVAIVWVPTSITTSGVIFPGIFNWAHKVHVH